MRIVIGNVIFPPVRQRYRPTGVISWSRQGYENASYCISQTGRQPAMQSPTALPRIAASASGVSTQRFSPKRSRNPAVARKTPPARPTSSPITITVSSRASSTWKPSLIASTMKSSGIPALAQVRRRKDIRVVEYELGIRGRLCLGLGDAGAHRVERLVLDLLGGCVVEHTEAAEIGVVATDALVALLLLDAVEVDVGARVVGRGMRRGTVGDGLDARRPATGGRPPGRLASRLVHREHVAAVDAHARHPVADGLVGKSLGARLRLERRRDRPLVVVAEENQRRLHDRREVGALVEGALARRAVAEVGDRDGRVALQLLAPGDAGGVRDVGRDRHADRGDAVVRRIPPPGGMTPPPVENGARRHPAQQPDRRLAIAGEDPVVTGERVHRADLHGLVIPEDRVRADPALAVVDDRALVVGSEEDERAMDREQLVGAEAFDLAVLVDHTPKLVFVPRQLCHRAGVYVARIESPEWKVGDLRRTL